MRWSCNIRSVGGLAMTSRAHDVTAFINDDDDANYIIRFETTN